MSSSQTTARQLTPTEMLALDKEYKQLAIKVETQTLEQREFLRKHIATDKHIGDAHKNRLDQVLTQGGFKLSLFRITEANVLDVPNVQVTYTIDDELWEYLKRPDSVLPPRLVGFLDGGTLIDSSQATAEDPSPMTGKTRTNVPQYDELIARGKTTTK